MHLAARFCAKEAVAKALALEVWNPHDVEVVRRRRAADGAPRGHAAARARELGVDVDVSLTHTRGDGGRGGGAARDAFPRWLEPLPDAEQMRATDALGDRGPSGVPVAGADGARRGGPRRASSPSTRPRGGSPSSAARATTAATGSSPRGCCARPGRDVDVLAVWPPEWMSRDARRRSSACPAPAAERLRARPPRRAHVIVDALLGTGFAGAPREPADAVIAAINAARAPRDRRRRPERRRRLDRRGRRARRCAPSRPRRSTAPSPASGSSPARRTRARSRWSTSASRAARPARPEAGLIGAGVLREHAAPRRRLDEVLQRATCSSSAARAG